MDAVAPYNFVELPARIIPAEDEALLPVSDRYEASRHTGWLDLEMTALTPLYTRGVLGTGGGFPAPIATVGQGETVQTADFFHRGEHEDGRLCRPLLPGSSLRGMFETVFEIMAQSRPRFVSSHRPFYRYFASRQSELRQFYANTFEAPARLVAGILRRRLTSHGEQWYLEVSNQTSAGLPARGFFALPVQRLPPQYYALRGKRAKADVYKTRPVVVRPTGGSATLLQGDHALSVPEAVIVTQPSASTVDGVLVLPGPDLSRPKPNQHLPSRSWYQVVLTPEAGSRQYSVPREVYSDYLEWGRTAHGSRFSRNSQEAPRVLENGSPAFALISHDKADEVAAIGANMMLSLRHGASPQELSLRPYQDLPLVDMAQALFGYVPTSTEANLGMNSIRSRVFVEDAECASPSWYLSADDPVRVPPPLLGPKIAAVQMYLEQPEAEDLRHYSSADAQVRGLKRYWHQPSVSHTDALSINDSPLDPTDTLLCPVKTGTKFVGRVRFENLTDAELGGLYACVQLPWDEPQNICLAHKFGMGKSFGMGSLRVTETCLVLLNMQNRYTTFRRPAGTSASGQLTEVDARYSLRTGYQAFAGRVGSKGQLWRRPRMRALANLLAWRPAPMAEIHTVGVQSEQWKNRVPLGSVDDNIIGTVPDAVPPEAAKPHTKTPLPGPLQASASAAALPSAQQSVNQSISFAVGDTIAATVLKRFGKSQGDVSFEDGTAQGGTLKSVQLRDKEVGEMITMIITAVNREGRITGTKPAAPV